MTKNTATVRWSCGFSGGPLKHWPCGYLVYAAAASQMCACAADAMARQTSGLEVEQSLMFHGLRTSRHLEFIGKMMM
jgi:hypothetical protein